MKEKCKNCRFFYQEYHGEKMCRRYPPVETTYGTSFPTATVNQWCGEFRFSEEYMCEMHPTVRDAWEKYQVILELAKEEHEKDL